MRGILLIQVIVCHLFGASAALAQQADGPLGFEFGLQTNVILPHKVKGASDIFYTSGVRAGYPIPGSEIGYFEGALSSGEEDTLKWTNASMGARVGVPLDSLIGVLSAGLEITDYESSSVGKDVYAGFYLGGGFMTAIAGGVWFRSEMRMVFDPGTTMQIGFALMYRFSGGGGN